MAARLVRDGPMLGSLLLSFVFPSPASSFQDDPDSVVLASGETLAGRVLHEDDTKLVLRSKRKEREIPRSDVREVQSIERSLVEFFQRFDQIDAGNAEALSDLALFCESRGLDGEAYGLWVRVLTIDPESERAWTKLGGVNRSGTWRLKVRGRFYTLEQLRERLGDWKNALELPTAHFLLRTDIPPREAIDAAIDLERVYVTFYSLLGPQLGLYVFDETPEVHVFSDVRNYPTPPTPGQRAWFSRSQNVLYVDASGERNAGEVVAEFSEVMIFNSFRRTLGKTGDIAPWAREGLAQAFGAAVRRDPGHVRFDFESPYRPSFLLQASEKDALSLEQVLRAGFGSFDSGSNAQRYVAQSYTLVHFLVFADSGRWRAAFARYLQSSFLGQSSTTHFEEALGIPNEDLEAAWVAYVKEIGS